MSIETLLQRTDLWRGGVAPLADPASILSTGRRELDAQLGGGWPLGALTELLTDRHGVGEVSLLLPALAALTRTGRRLAWVAPPHLPCAHALVRAGVMLERLLIVESGSGQETLWALEQSLRAGICVLGWPRKADFPALRRLQLAAEEGKAAAFLYRSEADARHPSPAALRLALVPTDGRLDIRILKQRGSTGSHAVAVRRPGPEKITSVRKLNAAGNSPHPPHPKCAPFRPARKNDRGC